MFDSSTETDVELLDGVLAHEATARRNAAMRYRRLAALYEREVCHRLEASTVGNWVAAKTARSHKTCGGEVTLAVKLSRHLSLVLDALEEGRISEDHAKAIARAANPRILPGIAAIQQDLLDEAQDGRIYQRWHNRLRTLADELDADGGHDPDTSDKIGLTITENYDGTFTVRGTLSQADGLALQTELHRVTESESESESDPEASQESDDESGGSGEDDAAGRDEGDDPVENPDLRPPPDWFGRNKSQSRARALGQLARRSGSRAKTDLKPPRPEIIVLYDLSSGTATTLDGTPLQPSTLLDHLSRATWRRMWTGDGVPLDFGRRRREASRDQKVALAVQYGGCAWPDCPNPATGCHAHHDDEWDADHGPTDLDNLVPLCAYHHTVAHRSGWKRTRGPDGTITWTSPKGRTFTSTKKHRSVDPTLDQLQERRRSA